MYFYIRLFWTDMQRCNNRKMGTNVHIDVMLFLMFSAVEVNISYVNILGKHHISQKSIRSLIVLLSNVIINVKNERLNELHLTPFACGSFSPFSCMSLIIKSNKRNNKNVSNRSKTFFKSQKY